MVADGLRYVVAQKPAIGTLTELAPGILWLRQVLPFALDHINLYLFEETDGWALLDTGIANQPSRDAWEQVLTQGLGGKPITRLVVSHFHPDHIGLAGWFHRRFGMPFHISQTEYFFSQLLQHHTHDEDGVRTAFYRASGLDEQWARDVTGEGHSYLKMTTGVPPRFERLIDGEEIVLGGRTWQILTGGGHAPEQVMLWCRAEGLFFSADQVLPRISPNISVFEMQPNANPLKEYLESLHRILAVIPAEVLVMPSHNIPFRGLHDRVGELIRHHDERCGLIAAACRDTPQTCHALMPVMFQRVLDAHQMGFAIGEAIAHLNYMMAEGRMTVETAADGTLLYRTGR